MAMLLRSLRARVIARGARNYRAYADLAVAYEERDWRSNGTWNRVQRMPAGPAAVITPWNAPFMLSTWKTAPALAAGCTVVLKPAEWSPLCCSLLADLVARGGLPARRLQRRPGHRRGGRRRAGRHTRCSAACRSPARPRPGRLIGVAAAREPRPVHRRARRQEPADRLRRRRPRRRRQEGRGPVRRRRPGLPGRHAPAGPGERPRRVPGALPRGRRRARARRPARGRDDDLAADPPRPPRRASRASSSARAQAGDTIVRGGAPRRRAALRADADRAARPTTPRSSRTRSSARCSRSRRFATEDEADRARQLDRVRAVGHRLHGSLGRADRVGRAAARRDRVGQHVPRARPHGAVRRRRHLGDRPRGRQLRARLLLGPQDAADPRRHRAVSSQEERVHVSR